ncbi:MAG: O-antigen ligase family protein [Pseudomonadota bacterium]
MSHPGWKFTLGFLVAFGLISAPFSRPLLPMFSWFFVSSRDVMLVWTMILGFTVIGLMAWKLSPAYTWFLIANLVSAIVYGFQGDTVPNLTMVALGTMILVFLAQNWKSYHQYIYFGLLVGILTHFAIALMQMTISDLGWPAPAGLVWRDPFFVTAKAIYEAEGLASHYSLMAGLVIVALPLLIARYRYGWLLLVPALAHVWYSQHRSSAIALVTLLFVVPRKYIALALISVLLFMGGVLYVRGASRSIATWTGDRVMVWTVTTAKAMQRPFVGWGPGTFNRWRPTFIHETTKMGLTWTQAHNEYVQTLFDTGFLGFLSFPLFLGWMLRRLWKARPWTMGLRGAVASTVALMLICFVSFPFRIGVTAVGGLITLAALHGELDA